MVKGIQKKMQQPPNFLFVGSSMVKTPRNGRQCLDTAVSPLHVPLQQHLPTPRCSYSLACFKSTPKTSGLHCSHLFTPFPWKRNLSKDTFFSGYNYHVAEGNGRPSIICQQQGGGRANKNKKNTLSNMVLETINMKHQQLNYRTPSPPSHPLPLS